MKKNSYAPSNNIKLNLTKRVIKTPDKIIKTRKSIKNKLSNIKYFIDNENNTIYNINNDKSKIQTLLIDNLKKNRRINMKNIIPPKQCGNNCWFNVLFMSYFISDKGRKFTKAIRLSMITGKYNKNLVEKSNYNELSNSLFLFNLAIEGALNGSTFSNEINTNEIIENIYNSINIPENWMYYKGFGNPLVYYEGLINFLYSKAGPPIVFFHLTPYVRYSISDVYNANLNKFPHVIVLEILDDQSIQIDTKKTFITLLSTNGNKKVKYKLDSICIRDINQSHVGCLVTLNNSGYLFDADGPLKQRIKPLNWNNSNFINSDESFSLGNNYSKFNMRKGYQILYYYRI